MSTEQEALRLASELEAIVSAFGTPSSRNAERDAAAMLRKLVAEREADRAAMREALGDVEWAIKTVCRYDPPGFPPNHIGKRLDGAATDLRQRLEGTT